MDMLLIYKTNRCLRRGSDAEWLNQEVQTLQLVNSTEKEEMLSIFNTAAATKRRLGNVFVEYVNVKRTTIGTQPSE